MHDDYSEIFDKIQSLVEQNGDGGVLGVEGGGPLSNPKITINEFYVESIYSYANDGYICLYTNAMTGFNTGNNATLEKGKIRFSYCAGSDL